jgi:hypothetical protein
LVTAKSPGTAIIEVTTNSGGKTATCLVTVSAPTANYSVTMVQGQGWTISPFGGSASSIPYGGSFSFNVLMAEGYDPATLVVSADDAIIDQVDGIYTLWNITSDMTVSATAEKYVYTVSIPSEKGFTVTAMDDHRKISHGGSFSFTVEFHSGVKSEVRVNKVIIVPDENGVYRVENIIGDVEITVGDIYDEEPEDNYGIMLAIAAIIAAVVICAAYFLVIKKKA